MWKEKIVKFKKLEQTNCSFLIRKIQKLKNRGIPFQCKSKEKKYTSKTQVWVLGMPEVAKKKKKGKRQTEV